MDRVKSILKTLEEAAEVETAENLERLADSLLDLHIYYTEELEKRRAKHCVRALRLLKRISEEDD